MLVYQSAICHHDICNRVNRTDICRRAICHWTSSEEEGFLLFGMSDITNKTFKTSTSNIISNNTSYKLMMNKVCNCKTLGIDEYGDSWMILLPVLDELPKGRDILSGNAVQQQQIGCVAMAICTCLRNHQTLSCDPKRAVLIALKQRKSDIHPNSRTYVRHCLNLWR